MNARTTSSTPQHSLSGFTGMRRATALTVGAATAVALAACSSDPEEAEASAAPASTSADAPPGAGTAITITVDGQTITGTLNDSQVARDFAEMLPVTVPAFRNGSIEYISELSDPLTETGPFYTDVQPGDIVYYNPADSITIIYEETSSVPTLTKMGEITSDLGVFDDLPDDVDMLIEAG